jgi:lathosterol oxidase
VFTVPFFGGEVLGQSMLYGGMPQTAFDWAYLVASIPTFLFFTDCGIYWFHRWMHHPKVYQYLHKLHHKWVIATPFASHAFNPMDGFIQSLPYHIYAFMIPMHKYLYLGMFVFVNCWTVMIHDGMIIYLVYNNINININMNNRSQ